MGIQAAYHKHVIQFIIVGTENSLFDYFIVDFLDDVQVLSYDKHTQLLKAKEDWVIQTLGAKFIAKTQQKLLDHEKRFLWFLKKLMLNETKHDGPVFMSLCYLLTFSLPPPVNHTVQIFAFCEIESDSHIRNEIQIAVDGHEFSVLDGEMGIWIALMPEARSFLPILTSTLWTTQREHYMQEYCIDTMKKILQHSVIKKNVPPEVTVSQYETEDGITTLSCSATGFYPRSILLHWQNGKNIIMAGKQSSSGVLPNADSTFYQRITIELLPEDTGTDYDCVVDHIELGPPKAYPIQVKYPKKRSWTVTITILSVVILVLSCTASFIVWKKMKTGVYMEIQEI
ncbi:class I histocompatibility antigen, F10 alpha chain-like [Antechinus flavipes]|uniref:class I histocompatibility antigen, F10 alpha chain-like n=1 Tax=Antechinus flavipes TaxID=38775 RepID=UPI00223580E6|nr:class I histocompatibility antigen, F10 alpha chain-like [Antechinus flavipes]